VTPREIVKAALHFQHPARIPFTLPKPWQRDLMGVGREPARNRKQSGWERRGDAWYRTDEMGNIWRRVVETTSGEVLEGVIEKDWRLLDSYEWPDVADPAIWEKAAARCRELHAQGFYVLGSINWPFNTTRYMRRLEVYLADLIGERENVLRLLGRGTDMTVTEIENYARIGADGVFGCEDWGTQDRLLVSPKMWREIFKPVFRRICEAAHARGIEVFLHSCGHVTEVMDDWVEVGLDCCQFDQPELHGIDYLAERYRGRLTIWSPVDIQRTLQTRDVKKIQRAAKEYVEKLGGAGRGGQAVGGFIAGYYGSNEGIGLDPKVQAAACRAFTRYGDPRNLLGLPEELRRVDKQNGSPPAMP